MEPRWLRRCHESFEVKKLEIVFVIDKDKLDTFELTNVIGEGLLLDFGWQKGEEKQKVEFVGIRGLYNLSN
ncbi:hypothetical protein GQ600_5036 [Phytophthora cactorum]|nr:hypothetical protein GQ600_5036 [Phytophthora cactorum]